MKKYIFGRNFARYESFGCMQHFAPGIFLVFSGEVSILPSVRGLCDTSSYFPKEMPGLS